MTAHQVILIKKSWGLVAPNADTVGGVFYANLFAIDPNLRRLFPDDMRQQPHRLMVMLTLLINELENAETVTRELIGLARRHQKYGVQPAHYTAVGQALIQTLHDGLGEHWTTDVQTAWGELYQTVATAMITLTNASAVGEPV